MSSHLDLQYLFVCKWVTPLEFCLKIQVAGEFLELEGGTKYMTWLFFINLWQNLLAGEDDQEELSIEIHEYLNSMSGRTEEGRYRCLICGQTCRDLYNQREHLMTHMVRDDKFKHRLDKFMTSNVIKDPKNNTTCLICRAPVTCNIRKHFLSKHLREPKSNYVQLPDESF